MILMVVVIVELLLQMVCHGTLELDQICFTSLLLLRHACASLVIMDFVRPYLHMFQAEQEKKRVQLEQLRMAESRQRKNKQEREKRRQVKIASDVVIVCREDV